MTLVNLPGSPTVFIGPGQGMRQASPIQSTATCDAANEALIFIGRIHTSDGGSHTIDTTGSSSIGWRTGAVTFANAGTTVKVGLSVPLATAGPPGRATNASDVITFDVSKSMTGGGGGVTANAWQTHVPDSGSKTIANGDFVAFAVQMTARGGADTVDAIHTASDGSLHRPTVTTFAGSAYSTLSGVPNCIITFSDGALGFFEICDVNSSINTRTWNSGSATKEYGQLYTFDFPMKIYGIYGWVAPTADFDCVLYSDPLGTPVAEKTVSIDANTVASTAGRRFYELFASPYSTTAGQLFGAVFKPGASNISAYYKTIASAGHRAADPWGTSGYGISRASGAFANANSSLDHYYIGIIAGAFDAGGSTGRSVQINNDSLVAS